MASKKQKESNSRSKKGSWECGERVMVRADRYKWLQGKVKRLARGGVAIWVEEARLVVHVPLQLAATHLSRASAPATAASSLLRLPTAQPDRCLVLAVRPAHLSHRLLVERFLKTDTLDVHVVNPQTPAQPDHTFSLDSPVTAQQNHRPGNRSSMLTVEPLSASLTPPLSPGSSTSSRALQLLESIPETQDASDWNTAPPAKITGGGRFSGPPLEVPVADINWSVSSSSSPATTPSPGRQSLAERIKKLKIPSSEKTSPNGDQSQSLPSASWITVIQDGVQNKTVSQ